MPEHRCLFCGGMVTDENVLFTHDYHSDYYTDTLRYTFLMQCSTGYPLENMDQFKGVYFSATEANNVQSNARGFPVSVYVRLSEGLTPEALLARERNPLQAAPPETNAEADAAPLYEPYVHVRTRACPHCHCKLPERFGELPVITVSLMGGRAAGKTAYIISLLQQLDTQLEEYSLGSVALLPESETYIRPQAEYYVENGGTTIPTSNEHLFPFVFYYHNNFGNHNYECYIILYDIAGEGVTDLNYLANHNGIRNASILLLIIDPNQINGGGYHLAIHEDAVQPGQKQHDYYDEQISRFLQQRLQSIRPLVGQLKHVITVLTKLDLPLRADSKLFDTEKPLLIQRDLENTHRGRVSIDAMREVDRELSTYFKHYLHADIKHLIRQQFYDPRLTVQLLGVSTYTLEQFNSDGVATFVNDCHPPASKHRIIEPFLAILAYAHMIARSDDPAPASAPAPRRSKAGAHRGKRWPIIRRT